METLKSVKTISPYFNRSAENIHTNKWDSQKTSTDSVYSDKYFKSKIAINVILFLSLNENKTASNKEIFSGVGTLYQERLYYFYYPLEETHIFKRTAKKMCIRDSR